MYIETADYWQVIFFNFSLKEKFLSEWGMAMEKQTNFITNNAESKSMKERITEFIKESVELNFLVGFFYFSGIKELYESLKELDDKNKLKEGSLKILVGLHIDCRIYGIYEVAIKKNQGDKKKEIEEFCKSLQTAFTSEEMDNKETAEQVEFFIKLLKEGKLIIRKTVNPNHAKLYLFIFNSNITKNLFITGSSNLTKAGLESQDEFNVEIKDYGFDEAKKYFDRLWENAIELDKQDIIDTLENKTFFKKVSPFHAYAYLLKTYLELYSRKHEENMRNYLKTFLKEKGYKIYDYQIDAALQAVEICKKHNGVILADVVGLGKTITASLVAKALGKKGMVICPPHLTGNKSAGWKKYLTDFELNDWKVKSLGNLKKALNVIKKIKT